ncbi:uncharacterized protein LOC144650096 [Oculina patagonica]
MEKRSAELLFVLVSCCVYLSISVADTSCPKVAEGTAPCSDDEDKKIMECCLKNYKLGFDNLPPHVPGQEPPSCAVDLGLAQCLSQSRCFGKPLTNGLRLLILNQLVFTKRVRICNQNYFQGLLTEAKLKSDPGFLDDLKKVMEMDNMPQDPCATYVYAICGREFKEELEKHPGYNPAELCAVFVSEGGCIKDTAQDYNCTESAILNRFKLNSDLAAGVVLSAICPSSQQ